MANSINTNYGAAVALQSLNKTNAQLETTQNRHHGYRDAMSRHGLPVDDDLIAAGAPAMAKPAQPELASGNDPMIIFFSSGTTGMPKMVQHGHTYPLGHFMTAAYWHDLEPDDVHLTLADSGWSKSSWGKLYGQWLCRSTVFAWDFRGKFQPKELLKILESHAITTFCAPPTVYRYLVREDLAAYDLSALRHCTTAGELLNESVFHAWKAATGLSL